MPNGQMTIETFQILLLERLSNKPKSSPHLDASAIAGGYTCTFLASMLKSVKPEESDSSHILSGSIDPYNPTGLPRTVVRVRINGQASLEAFIIQSDDTHVPRSGYGGIIRVPQTTGQCRNFQLSVEFRSVYHMSS